MIRYRELAREEFDYIREVRRWLHRHPELSAREFGTSAMIARELERMGLEPVPTGSTGLYADLKGCDGDLTLALRADMDALPIHEQTGLDYASQEEGVMHACGHDSHVAILLGAARLLLKTKDRWQGRIRCLFQPAEETGLGARQMIRHGSLKDVDGILGLHLMPMRPVGTFQFSSGPVLPGASRFAVTFRGRSSHGVHPEQGRDALAAACAAVHELYAASTRAFGPFEKKLIHIGLIRSGDAHNIVASEALVEGTVRAFEPSVDAKVRELIDRVTSSTGLIYGCETSSEFGTLSQPLVNDPRMTELARQVVVQLTGQDEIAPFDDTMASDDFSAFASQVTGLYVSLGAGGDHPPHSAFYQIDEEAVIDGAAFYAAFASQFLNGWQNP